MAFFDLTAWFLTDITDTTPVHIGTILNPWRANENTQTALLGGVPAVVYSEGLNLGAAEVDPGFVRLKATHPTALVWGFSPEFEQLKDAGAGQQFVFRYRILDGCLLVTSSVMYASHSILRLTARTPARQLFCL